MRQSTPETKTAKSLRRRARLRRFGRGLLYTVIVLIAVHLTATAITGVMLSRELSRLRSRGEVLDIAALAPKVPAGARNAADVYQQAFDALRLSKDEQSAVENVLWPDRTYLEQKPAVARAALAANGRYFSLVAEASQIPDCAFPVKWSGSPFDAQFPHYGKLRRAAIMLVARAHFAREDGRLDDAARDLVTALHVEDHAQRDPILIAALVAGHIQNFVDHELPHLLSAGDASPDLLRQLRDQSKALRKETPDRNVMRGERAWNLKFFEAVRAHRVPAKGLFGDDPPLGPRVVLALWPNLGRPLMNLDEIASLDVFGRYLVALEQPYRERMSQSDTISNQSESLPLYRAFLTRMVTPVMKRAFESYAARDTSLGLTACATRLALYHQAHGRYPAALSDLTGKGEQWPNDPFSSQPYHYRLEGNGYRLWSVGTNGVDDGGDSSEVQVHVVGGAWRRIQKDIVWVVTR